MARRYLLRAVEEAINDRPMWTMSKALKESVNENLLKNGWSRNIGPAHIGILARILAEEGRIMRRPVPIVDRLEISAKRDRYEYKPLIRIGLP